MSIPTMYSYIKRRNEAIVNGLTIELLQPKLHEESMGRKKANSKAKTTATGSVPKPKQKLIKSRVWNNIRHDMELLEELKLREAAREHAITGSAPEGDQAHGRCDA